MKTKKVPDGDNEGKYTKEFKKSLMRSLYDIKNGRTHALMDIKE
jgi:hypothetical protein